MKRGSALLLACLMAVGLSTTAFAEEPQTVVDTESGSGGASISITDITSREEQEDETESPFQTRYYPIAVKTIEDMGVRLLVKTFLVPKGTDPQALVEEGLTRRGVAYQVSDILMRELEGDTQTKPVTKTVTTPAETDDTEELLALLAPPWPTARTATPAPCPWTPPPSPPRRRTPPAIRTLLRIPGNTPAWTEMIPTISPNPPKKTV